MKKPDADSPEFQKFNEAMKTIIKAPKAEVDQAMAEAKAKRKKLKAQS